MSGVQVVYSCGGCDAVTMATPRQEVEVVGSAVMLKRTPTIVSAAPEGWMVFDPYTGCVYCPSCWRSIEHPAPLAVRG